MGTPASAAASKSRLTPMDVPVGRSVGERASSAIRSATCSMTPACSLASLADTIRSRVGSAPRPRCHMSNAVLSFGSPPSSRYRRKTRPHLGDRRMSTTPSSIASCAATISRSPKYAAARMADASASGDRHIREQRVRVERARADGEGLRAQQRGIVRLTAIREFDDLDRLDVGDRRLACSTAPAVAHGQTPAAVR